MSKAIFHGNPETLRSPQRLRMLQVDTVIKHTLAGFNAASLLDIGTGTGIFAEAFQKQGLSIAGVDHNPAMLEQARKFVPSGIFKTGTADDIPFENKQFDLSFMGLLFHEVPDEEKALIEAVRVSRNGIAILEWLPRVSQFGPNLEKRIKPERLKTLCKHLHLGTPIIIELDHLALYLIAVNPHPSSLST